MRLLEVTGVVVEEDELLVSDLRQTRHPTPGEPVPGIDDEHQLILIQRQALHVGMAHRPRETELDLFVQGHLQDRLRMRSPHRDGNPWMRRREPLQQPGQGISPHPRRSPDPQSSPRSPPELLQPPLALLKPAHDPLRVRQKLLARLRKPHPPTRPNEKRIPNLLLQRLEPRRQGWLREIHLLGSPAQVTQPRHRNKTLQLSKEHARGSFQSPAISLWRSAVTFLFLLKADSRQLITISFSYIYDTCKQLE